VCTVLLRFAPGDRWPLLVGAVRDEFVDRAWDPPAAHWTGAASHLLGGRDRAAGGTWLAVDPDTRAFAALLNGARLPPPPDGVRPSRGALPLLSLAGQPLPDPARYDGYHLLRGTPEKVELWSWDGVSQSHRGLEPGDHIVVNDGPDSREDPLVAHFAPLLARARDWDDWVELLGGAGLDPADPRALVMRLVFDGRTYGSTSASMLALAPDAVRYAFTANPGPDADWYDIRA
jgi:uncharacterized protein with NRDE domain